MDTTPTDTTSSDTPDSTILPSGTPSDSNSSSSEENSFRLFNMEDKETRYRLKVLAEALWKEGYRPISRDVRDGRSSILDEEIERILSGESDALMRNHVQELMNRMPEIIMSASTKVQGIFGIVVSNRF
jgi:hypothetical protein